MDERMRFVIRLKGGEAMALHRNERLAILFANVVDGADVGVVQGRNSLLLCIPLHNEVAPCAIQPHKRKRLKRRDDPAHTPCIQRNEIRIAVHEAHVSSVGADLRLVSRE